MAKSKIYPISDLRALSPKFRREPPGAPHPTKIFSSLVTRMCAMFVCLMCTQAIDYYTSQSAQLLQFM